MRDLLSQNVQALDDSNVVFSMFTCTYNRADLLPRVYEALSKQTFRGFEWIIYNNGSTDDTEALVKSWIETAPFTIRYYSRPDNSGIQRAYNEGVRHARGRFWVMMDSDDACVPNALERFYALWNEIPAANRHQYVGVTVNCADQHGDFVGTPFPESPLDSTIQETTWRHRVRGEKWGMQRVDVLSEIPFQDVPDHIQPGAIWRKIARKYKTRYANETLRVYYIDEPDREDQLSHHYAMNDINSVGQRVNTLDVLDNEMRWFFYDPVDFLKTAVIYSRYCDKLGIPFIQQLSSVQSWSGRLLVVVAWPAKIANNVIKKIQYAKLQGSKA